MQFPVTTNSKNAVLNQLRAQIQRLERPGRALRHRQAHPCQTSPDNPATTLAADDAVPTGLTALDRLLPDGGLLPGTLVEWLAARRGSGASLLACAVAHRVGRPSIIVDCHSRLNPVALLALGMAPQDLVIVRPESARDELWAVDQALRCPAVGSVVAWLDALPGRTFRRLQLAAETSGAIGCLIRSAAVRREPTWADLRFVVCSHGGAKDWKVDIELIRCRDGRQGSMATVSLAELVSASHETSTVRLASQLADPTKAR